MQNTFFSLVEEVAQKNSLSLQADRENNTASFLLGNTKIKIYLYEKIESLAVQILFVPLPKENKEKIYSSLLKLNYAFQLSYNCIFGIDNTSEYISLQTQKSMKELDAESLYFIIQKLFDLAVSEFHALYAALNTANTSFLEQADIDIEKLMMNSIKV